ncbi:zinc-binding dehydrogenase [Streptomyces sp. NPDC059989]|uniref:zinc-binding dehydrogenase n=1 Tax=Streptomyces sp. NPDC059989 TaxID=3347026 RepID=UPI0036CD8943
MRAFVPTGRTSPGVVREEVPEPRPRPDEALVKVEAYSVNRGETFQLEAPAPGWRPGKDVAGLVVRSAADGSGPEVGRRVVGHPPAAGWAEYAAVPTDALAVLPDSLPAVRAAALPLAGLTALRLLRTAGPVAGRRILLTGASGGVGHYFTELAAAAGAEVTAVTAAPERGHRLLELGAVQVVRDPADAEGAYAPDTPDTPYAPYAPDTPYAPSTPFDLVLESTGGTALPAALARLRRGGTLIWFGQAGRKPVTLDFFDFFKGPESATLRHFHYADSDTPYGEDLATLVRLVASGRLHPEIGRVADWAETDATLTDLRERRIRGNAVLTLS